MVVENSIVAKVAEWSEEKLTDEQLLQALEDSRPDLEQHRIGFEGAVADLTEGQREHCQELIDFCFTLLDGIAQAVDQAAEAVKSEDRNSVFIAGDTIARSSFQLNQAFAELRNQALLALGPTEIPNFNLLISRKDDFLEEPDDNNATLFMEAIDVERVVVYHALEDLAEETRIPEVETLINAFRDHMACLNKLAETLTDEGEEGDYESLFLQLGVSFPELQKLVPMVQMKLRGEGETKFPDLNGLLKLMDDVAEGNIGDAPLLDAVEAIEESFSKSRDQLEEAEGALDSALANDEVGAAVETFEEFEDAVEAIYKFLEQRDTDWLLEARGCILEFAKRYSAHQQRLKEIEEQQGQLLCPMCSTSNDSSRTRCSKCGGPLPQNIAAATTTTFESKEKTGLEKEESGPLITANIEKLYLAVNGVSGGTLGHEEFLSAVDQFENTLETNVGSLPAEPEVGDEQKQQALDKVYDAFEQGVETLREALDMMRRYPSTEDEESLAAAVRMVDEGAKLIAAAGEAASR